MSYLLSIAETCGLNILLALSDAEDVARKLAEAQKNVSSVLFSSARSLSDSF